MTPTRLREILKLLDWSQRGLARLVEAHNTEIQRCANGDTPVPGWLAVWLETLAAVHEAHPPPRWPRSRDPENPAR